VPSAVDDVRLGVFVVVDWPLVATEEEDISISSVVGGNCVVDVEGRGSPSHETFNMADELPLK
jgi:hypothetical protein